MSKNLNPLAAINVPGLVPSAEETAKLQKTSAAFIPPLKLLQGLSPACENPENQPGDFMRAETNLGKKIDIVMCGRRNHAIKFENNSNALETYDVNSPIWDDIVHTKQRGQEVITTYGSEWLFWLIEHAEFCTYLCGKISTKPLSDALLMYITPPEDRKPVDKDKPQTFAFELSAFMKSYGPKKRSWAPIISPLTMDSLKSQPTEAQIHDIQETFYSPVNREKESSVETVDPDGVNR